MISKHKSTFAAFLILYFIVGLSLSGCHKKEELSSQFEALVGSYSNKSGDINFTIDKKPSVRLLYAAERGYHFRIQKVYSLQQYSVSYEGAQWFPTILENRDKKGKDMAIFTKGSNYDTVLISFETQIEDFTAIGHLSKFVKNH